MLILVLVMEDFDWISERAVSDVGRTRELSEAEEEYLYSIACQMCEAGYVRYLHGDLKLLCGVAENYPDSAEVLKVFDGAVGESFGRGYRNNFANWVEEEDRIKDKVVRNIGGLKGRLNDYLLGEFSGEGVTGVREGRDPVRADAVYNGGLLRD